MIIPETVAKEQQNKQEERNMIISIALEIYPHLLTKAEYHDSAAKQSLRAAKIFIEEASKL